MSELNNLNGHQLFILDEGSDTIKYNNVKERINSFNKATWKKCFIDPLYLAKAGFYFFEEPDRVKCFACNIVLGNWCIIDDAWKEHAFWSPDCLHVRDKKGDNFIAEVNRKWRMKYKN